MTAALATPIAQSVNPRAVVFPREQWKRDEHGQIGVVAGTWCPHKGVDPAGGTVVVPMLGCPVCRALIFVVPTSEAVRELRRMGIRFGSDAEHLSDRPPHQITRIGKIQPDLRCPRRSCDFHRPAYLDRWKDERPLWCVAYIEPPSLEVQFVYSHATTRAEALFEMGSIAQRARIIEAGPAVGVHVDERGEGGEV